MIRQRTATGHGQRTNCTMLSMIPLYMTRIAGLH